MKKDHDTYSNHEITVQWDQSKCIHSGVCYSELRNVFNPLQRPWVNLDGAEAEQVIRVVKRCPSGALSFEWNKEKEFVF